MTKIKIKLPYRLMPAVASPHCRSRNATAANIAAAATTTTAIVIIVAILFELLNHRQKITLILWIYADISLSFCSLLRDFSNFQFPLRRFDFFKKSIGHLHVKPDAIRIYYGHHRNRR